MFINVMAGGYTEFSVAKGCKRLDVLRYPGQSII
jgi:hypothetical protein